MDMPVSNDMNGRSHAKEKPLLALVERLTEKGVIQPEEAGDMLALLSACSGTNTPAVPEKHATGRRRKAKGMPTFRLL